MCVMPLVERPNLRAQLGALHHGSPPNVGVIDLSVPGLGLFGVFRVSVWGFRVC